VKAIPLLKKGCEGGNGLCCLNLAVMYKKGDKGVQINQEEYEKYKSITEDLVNKAKVE
jgi:TPR repeat protein